METSVKRLVRQARVMSSDDPDFVHAPRGVFIEMMWSDRQRDELGLNHDDYIAALREAWKHFYKDPVKVIAEPAEEIDTFSDAYGWKKQRQNQGKIR